MKKSKNITVNDIALASDVSIATVSRVLNNNKSVGEKTRATVLAVAEELGYYKKTISDNISESKKTIVMFVPDFVNPFTSTIISGVLASANEHSYKVIFAHTANFDNTLSDYLNFLSTISPRGIISLSSVPNINIVEAISRRYPIVMCSEYPDNYPLSFVSIDDVKAAETATNYLILIGKNKIAMINGSLKNKYARHRQKGFIKTLENNNMVVNHDWILNLSKVEYKLAFSNILSLLTEKERPNAIFAASDVYAIAAVNAAKSLGIKIPEELAVIGFDNESISIMSAPSITTIMQPSYQIGYQSMELLIEQINSKVYKDRQIILDTELIVRESTNK